MKVVYYGDNVATSETIDTKNLWYIHTMEGRSLPELVRLNSNPPHLTYQILTIPSAMAPRNNSRAPPVEPNVEPVSKVSKVSCCPIQYRLCTLP
jgi:hypothetical protein